MGLFYMAIADGTFFINFDNKIDRVFLPILLFGLPGLSFTIGAVVPRFICDKKRKIIKQSPPLQLSEKVEFETLKIDYNEHELKTINLSPKMERTFNGLKIISKIIVGLNLSFGLLLGIFLFQRTLIESNMVNTKYLNAFELLDVLAYSKYKLLFSIILVLTMFVLLIFSIKNIWVLIKGSADETQNFRFSLLIFICILCLNITLKRLSLMANETLIFQYSLNYSLQIWLAACLVIFNFSNRFTNKSYFLYIIQQVSHFKNRIKDPKKPSLEQIIALSSMLLFGFMIMFGALNFASFTFISGIKSESITVFKIIKASYSKLASPASLIEVHFLTKIFVVKLLYIFIIILVGLALYNNFLAFLKNKNGMTFNIFIALLIFVMSFLIYVIAKEYLALMAKNPLMQFLEKSNTGTSFMFLYSAIVFLASFGVGIWLKKRKQKQEGFFSR